MARARNIKPGFFANEVLVELPVETRLLFIGLWTVADREGRMEDRPKRIRADIFPYDMGLDVDQMLNDLQASGFLIRYDMNGARFIQVVNFSKHQNPHARETPSIIPPPPGTDAVTTITYDVSPETRAMVFSRDEHKCVRCGSPDRLSVDHITPRSKGGSNDESNLQTLCVTCNTSKNNRTYAEVEQGTAKAMTGHSQGDDRAQPRSPLTDSLNTDSPLSESGDSGADAPPPPPPADKPQAKPKRAARIPADFVITDKERKWALERGMTALDVERRTETFVNYWTGESGAKASKLDWFAAWKVWISRDFPDAVPRKGALTVVGQGKRPPNGYVNEFDEYMAEHFGGDTHPDDDDAIDVKARVTG